MGAVGSVTSALRDSGASLPLTMAAVTVAGQCRERSPSDLALFGDVGGRFADRFANPAEGEAMLAVALAEGAAEAEAELRIGKRLAPFRVSLWRQRGGQRIRVMASFAATAAEHGGSARPEDGSLRRPLTAMIGVAERLRNETAPAAPVGDLLAASWHMLRVIDEIPRQGRRPRLAEVDIVRLCGRLTRLATPLAEASGASLSASLEACARQSVIADEGALWGVLETMLHAAVSCAPSGGSVDLIADMRDDGGLELSVSVGNMDRVPESCGADLTEAAETAAENGLSLSGSGALPLRLTVPRGRLLAT